VTAAHLIRSMSPCRPDPDPFDLLAPGFEPGTWPFSTVHTDVAGLERYGVVLPGRLKRAVRRYIRAKESIARSESERSVPWTEQK
jgi:hypothetical protein